MRGAVIGRLDYEDCDDCGWMDAAGNCKANDTEFEDKLRVDLDDVICGCYKERDSSEASGV